MNKLLEFYRALKRDAFLEYAKEAVSFTDDESRMDAEIEAALAGPSEEERERLWRFVKPGLCGPLSMDDVINQRKLTQADIDEIRALILGQSPQGKGRRRRNK